MAGKAKTKPTDAQFLEGVLAKVTDPTVEAALRAVLKTMPDNAALQEEVRKLTAAKVRHAEASRLVREANADIKSAIQAILQAQAKLDDNQMDLFEIAQAETALAEALAGLKATDELALTLVTAALGSADFQNAVREADESSLGLAAALLADQRFVDLDRWGKNRVTAINAQLTALKGEAKPGEQLKEEFEALTDTQRALVSAGAKSKPYKEALASATSTDLKAAVGFMDACDSVGVTNFRGVQVAGRRPLIEKALKQEAAADKKKPRAPRIPRKPGGKARPDAQPPAAA